MRPRARPDRGTSCWPGSGATRREIVPNFNAYVYFRLGYSAARATSRARSIACGSATRTRPASRAITPPIDRRLPHQPPQQHGLHPRGVPRGREGGLSYAVGEWARIWPLQTLDPGDGRVLRAPQLARPALPQGARAVRRDGDRGRRHAGGLSRGRPLARREAAAAQARHPRLHAPLVRSGGRARHRLRPRRRSTTTASSRTAASCSSLDRGGTASRRGRTASRRRRASSPATSGCMARNRWHRFGYACVNFGSPVSLARARRGAGGVDFRAPLEGGPLARRSRSFGRELMGEVARVIPVVPVSLVATALRARARSGVERARAEGARSLRLMEELERARRARLHPAGRPGLRDRRGPADADAAAPGRGDAKASSARSRRSCRFFPTTRTRSRTSLERKPRPNRRAEGARPRSCRGGAAFRPASCRARRIRRRALSPRRLRPRARSGR